MTPEKVGIWIKQHIKREWRLAFLSAVLTGIAIHLPVMLQDIPNHDGLSSMYFDQNMITSGRWFLTVACGFSSYFTLPWLIGLLALLYLGCTAAALTELFELKNPLTIVLISGLLVSFPALASTFAYVFTMDGYMMGLLLAVLSVLLVKKGRWGFAAGGICLAFSMGIYQSYLPVAVLLSLYSVVILLIEEPLWKDKLRKSLRYLYMGMIGASSYYVILQVLLKIQGKTLNTYQGINQINGGRAGIDLPAVLKQMYQDFAVFTVKGGVLFNNGFSLTALGVLTALGALTLLLLAVRRKWWRKPGVPVLILLFALAVPAAANLILLISPELTYHLLMRYQWVVFLMILLVFVQRYGIGRERLMVQWGSFLAVSLLVFHYAVTDNIGYSNLQKRYEKTYAYCLRLLDRIEQTPGYYQGIPVAMVGVVGDDQYPLTDITQDVTFNMIGLYGDVLLYRAENYREFMKNYLGATLNFLDEEAMGDIYFREEYVEMESFPGATATRVVDGVLYVKTENTGRD